VGGRDWWQAPAGADAAVADTPETCPRFRSGR